MRRRLLLATGAAAVVGARAAFERVLLATVRRRVATLNAGDPGPTLALYADDAVLEFADGDHRWAGEHRGRAAIATFLRHFADAGIQGTVHSVWTRGWPWSLEVVLHFSDRVVADGRTVYANDTMLVFSTRWGRIVHHRDYYVDTSRIVGLEQHLRAHGR